MTSDVSAMCRPASVGTAERSPVRQARVVSEPWYPGGCVPWRLTEHESRELSTHCRSVHHGVEQSGARPTRRGRFTHSDLSNACSTCL